MSGNPYPTAPAAGQYQYSGQYPAQAGYPQQQYYGQPEAGYGYGGPPAYDYGAQQGPPPPYTEYPQQTAPASYSYAPMNPYPQQTSVMAPGLYDSGARFDGVAQPRLPPPPPGVAPNAAQVAAMNGYQVVGTQQHSDWLSGGNRHGGYSWI